MLAAVAATVVLSACGASAPSGRELADELIDTLEKNGAPVSDAVKDCMHGKVADFALTDEEKVGFKDLDDVAKKASEGQEQALAIMARFQQELASCNSAG